MLETIITIAVIILVLVVLFKVFKLVLRLLIIGVFLLICYFTNPDEAAHQVAVAEKAAQNDKSLEGKTVHVDDYKIFSLTKLKEGEDERLIGAGLLTMVWIFGSVGH